ncbi:MAG: hypothetical protein AB8B80_06145 [Marinicellaceae bacterium]
MTKIRLLFTILILQIIYVSNAHATFVSINGSENLTLMDDIVFDYSSEQKSISFNVANPFVCSNPIDNNGTSIELNVNSILDGNAVISAIYGVQQNVFEISTDADIQCASELGVFNDVIFNQSMEFVSDNIRVELKDVETGAILNSVNDIELSDGQLYQYRYEIRNTGTQSVNIDFIENYLENASPTFARDPLDGWACVVISGSFTNCGSDTTGFDKVSLQGATIVPNGQINVEVTRRVRVDLSGPNIKLDLLAATFINNSVQDINPFNNIAFTSFGTTTITASRLDIPNLLNNTEAGVIMTPIFVEFLDGQGVLDSSNNSLVTMSINDSSPSGGTLSGDLSVNAINGVATFTNLSIDKSGADYKLRATSSGVTGAISSRFDVNPSTASQLIVTTQPTGAVAQTAMPAIIVQAQDQFGNIATNYSGRVFANIKSGTGSLSGTNNPFASSGVATFNNLSVDTAGSGYTLLFSSGSLTSTVSNSFEITAIPSAANSTFGINPDSQIPNSDEQVAGTSVTVFASIRDVNNNPVGAGVDVLLNMQNTMGANATNAICTTVSNGQCVAQVTSTLSGVTTITASITGSPIMNIISGWSDVNTWIAGSPDASLSNFGVASASASVNSNVTLEAELRDQFGNLVEDESVTFQLIDSLSSTPPSTVCGSVTGSDGICTGGVTSSQQGSTTVKAFYGFPSVEITNTDSYNGLGKVINWIAPN